MTTHTKDSDCTVGDDGTCTWCGVLHDDPCPDCGWVGFHAKGCVETIGLQVQPRRNSIMSTYIVQSSKSGIVLGEYQGDSPEAALDACSVDAGYRDYEEACKVTGTDYIVAIKMEEGGSK